MDTTALTIETHIMVGEDGWAVPFGRAPDHHMQKAIRRLNVMLLWGTEATGHWFLENEVVEPLAKVSLLYHLQSPPQRTSEWSLTSLSEVFSTGTKS